MALEQVEHRARRVGEGPVGRRGRGRRRLDRAHIHGAHDRRKSRPRLTAGHPSSWLPSRAMKLATFLAPGASEPQAGEVRGDEIVAFAQRHRPRPPRLRRPHARRRAGLPARRRHAARARSRGRRAIFCIGRNYAAHIAEMGSREARQAARLPQAAALQRAARRAGAQAARSSSSSTTRPSWCWCSARTTTSSATPWPTTSPPATCRPPRTSGRAPRASTRSCPWGPWITTADEVADAGNLRVTTHVNGEQRQDGQHLGPDLQAARSSSRSSPRPARSSPARSSSPARRAASARRMDPPTFLQAGDVVRVEVEGLGALEHPVQ